VVPSPIPHPDVSPAPDLVFPSCCLPRQSVLSRSETVKGWAGAEGEEDVDPERIVHGLDYKVESLLIRLDDKVGGKG
jgi:hypothetical protein